jgi:hypothetical protein
MQEETSQAPPLPAEPPALLADTSTGAPRPLLTATERAALIARLDTSPTKADWAAWERDLEARLG